MLNSSQSEDAGADRRHFDRRRVLESGVIITADGRIDCQVTDVSPGGVRIRPVESVPESLGSCQFQFARIGVFEGIVRWRAGDAVGLGFVLSPAEIAEQCQILLKPEFGAT